MIHEPSGLAVAVFGLFVAITLGLSVALGRRTKTAAGFFAAGGGVPWFVNGIAFAGDYLSAASFLGICGMIAASGYDGFLYSIGYLAGWVVSLFVVAEPLKRLGKYTFADALDSQFGNRWIRLAAGLSALVVSLFYLVPQMVGAGALVKPLLGLPHWAGVCIVGGLVTAIVATAGMASTTWVQFLKGGLLLALCGWLTTLILNRGLTVADPATALRPQELRVDKAGQRFVDGMPQGKGAGQRDLRPGGFALAKPGAAAGTTGPLGPLEFLRAVAASDIVLWKSKEAPIAADGSKTTVYTPYAVPGKEVLLPGRSKQFAGLRDESLAARLNFVSLMLALFCGTASLPHILIRYYTVKDAAAARKSTVVGIAAIGAFYVLTLYLGLGAMTGGALDVTNTNMTAPLLAKSFGALPFALISAVAFTTVLGTVSGLVVAASGAVVHDLMDSFFGQRLSDGAKVRAGKLAAIGVGIVAILLGIAFEKMNVTFLVGWAFSVAASANLPALAMTLFWRGTTSAGIVASIAVGAATSLGWILLSQDTFNEVYGWSDRVAPAPFSQPGLVTIPLSFLTLVVVSLLTRRRNAAA
jgi:cation/acetate symporter